MQKINFVYCEKCGKKLIERLPNGLWKFVFGKKADLMEREIFSAKMRFAYLDEGVQEAIEAIREKYRIKPTAERYAKYSPVIMYIHGSIKMMCTKTTCDHWNVLHYFPKTNTYLTNQQEAENSGKNNEIQNKDM